MKPHDKCVTRQEVEEKFASSTPEEFDDFMRELSDRGCPFCKRSLLLAELKKPASKEGE